MKKIEVVAAIIHQAGRYFATQRANGEFKGMWEFPGGKVEQGETHEEALKREVEEELGVQIELEQHVGTTESYYPSFHLTMHCYLCSIIGGRLELREHAACCWVTVDNLHSLNWLPADEEIIEKALL